MKIANVFPLEEFTVLDSAEEFIGGVECEIEDVQAGQDFNNFTAVSDHSLRNSGIEYISQPLSSKQLLSSFANLHAKIKYRGAGDPFSKRTSTHVHVNCRNLDIDQVKSIVMLYALLEEGFFAMVNPDRRNNIHCVPLTETTLSSSYKESLLSLHKKWHKYTALNVCPLGKLGTIEFRHLQGTGDVEVFGEWLKALEKLWTLGKVISVNKDNVSDHKTIMLWYDEIFGHSPKMQALRPSIPNLIRNSVTDVKLSLIGT